MELNLPEKTSTANASSSSARNASAQQLIDGMLGKDQMRELRKRMMKKEILLRWFQQKKLEEEILVEVFGEDTVQRGKDSLMSLNNPVAANVTSNKPLSDVSKGVPFPSRGEGCLIGLIQGGASLNDRDCHDERPGTHGEGGMMDDHPFQCPQTEADKLKPKMLMDFGKGTSTSMVDAVKECAPEPVNKFNTPLMGGIDESATKKTKKGKCWECKLCQMKTSSEQLLAEHYNGKRHIAKEKAPRKTTKPHTSSQHNSESLPQLTEKLVQLVASGGSTFPTIGEHNEENLRAVLKDMSKLSCRSPGEEKHYLPIEVAASAGNKSPSRGEHIEENLMAQLEDPNKVSSVPPLEEKHEIVPGKDVSGTKLKIALTEEDHDNEIKHLGKKRRESDKAAEASVEGKQDVAEFQSCNILCRGAKILEEEIMVEVFREDTVQRGKDSLLPSDNPETANETGNKPLNDVSKGMHLPLRGEGSSIGLIQGGAALNECDRYDERPSTHAESGVTDDHPFQCHQVEIDKPKPEMLIASRKGTSTTLRGEGCLIGLIEGGASLNDRGCHDEKPDTHAEGGVMDDHTFQCNQEEADKLKPKMLIGLGKGTSTALVDAVKQCALEMVNKVNTPLVDGMDESATRTTEKEKCWECKLCSVKTTCQQNLAEHYKGKRHVAKEKASRKTSEPLPSNLNSPELLPQLSERPIELAASGGSTFPNIGEHLEENTRAELEDMSKLSSGSPVAEKLDLPIELAISAGNKSPSTGEHVKENMMALLQDPNKLISGPPPEEKHEILPGKDAFGAKRKIVPTEEDHGNEILVYKRRKSDKATKASVEGKQEVAEFQTCNIKSKIWFCKMCMFPTTSEEVMRNHRSGDQHMSLLRKHGRNVVVVCNRQNCIK